MRTPGIQIGRSEREQVGGQEREAEMALCTFAILMGQSGRHTRATLKNMVLEFGREVGTSRAMVTDSEM